VHDVFVRKPGYKFHKYKGQKNDKNPEECHRVKEGLIDISHNYVQIRSFFDNSEHVFLFFGCLEMGFALVWQAVSCSTYRQYIHQNAPPLAV
jgi:hypothetical protein